MMQTIEAVIDENGKVELLETVTLKQPRRALLTILEDAPETNPNKVWSNNRELLQAINDAYDGDDDADEKEFLRLMKNRTMRILDEWK